MSDVSALTAALDAEFASLYVYGVIGGRASRDGTPAERTRIAAAFAAHRTRRDQLIAFLVSRGAAVPDAAVAYQPPIDPIDAKTRTACAREIESRCEAVYAQLIAAASGPVRAFAITALATVGATAVELGAAPAAFPGLVL